MDVEEEEVHAEFVHEEGEESETVASFKNKKAQEKLMENLFQFMSEQGGSLSTATIVQKFSNIKTTKETLLFKEMLKQIAIFDTKTRTWTLKNI